MAESVRQLAAILFSDIVGYTAMMGSDEQNALEVLRKSREIQKKAIEGNGGKWLKEMGDGVLAQFATAYDAVKCSLEIQKRAHSELDAKIRIGIHLGDITVENEDVFGDGVNIASRLQSIADPGGIYISQSVNEAVHAKHDINTVFVADVRLKNVDHPIKTYYLKEEWLAKPSSNKIKTLSGQKQLTALHYSIGSILLVILISTAWWFSGKINNEIRSVAILQVSNLTGDSTKNILTPGIHGELRNEIAKITGLRVVSNRSMEKYKDQDFTLAEIAEDLNVDVLIEPDIYSFGDDVRMDVRMMKFDPEEQIWGDSFTRSAAEANAVYDDIVLAIANEAGIELSSDELISITNRSLIDPKAHEAYLTGYNYLYEGTKTSFSKAAEYFNLAIEIEPDYAQAYLGLAQSWGFRAQMGYVSLEEVLPTVLEIQKKALELDSTMVEAHYASALFNTWSVWDWATAEIEFLKTLKMDPTNEAAHIYYAQYLIIMGRGEEATSHAEEAVKLAPSESWIMGLYIMCLNQTRQYDEAEKMAKKILEEDPNPLASPALWAIYHNTGRYDEAIKVASEVYLEKREYDIVQILNTTFNENGYHTAMERVAETFVARRDSTWFPAWQIATLYTRADNREKAVEWLEKTYEEHDPNLPVISCDPIFDNLESNLGFQGLLDKMGLKRESSTLL